MRPRRTTLLRMIMPGMLVAATGVGAGDLLTAGLGGSAVGVGILWAVVTGAVLKWFLNEGIARWQMATGTTLLEGWTLRLGRWIQWIFMAYMLSWTFFTGGALITACGVAGTGLFPLGDDPVSSKIIWGVIHSFAGLLIVRLGGFRLFVKMMSACIVLMFMTVLFTAALSKPDWSAVGAGLVRPELSGPGLGWIVGIIGGVGGTLTLLSYGYWIREEKRCGAEGMTTCRVDLSAGYVMTALFGIAMVIIGSGVKVTGSGVNAAPLFADQLGRIVGPYGKLIFLLGFWGAVFSSLLGVWQSVPYLFTDFIYLRRGMSGDERRAVDYTATAPYRVYLYAISFVPLPVLMMTVQKAQLTYAVFGSLFMPLLALTLLIMNNREQWIGKGYKNGLIVNTTLTVTLLFFTYVGYTAAADRLKILFGAG